MVKSDVLKSACWPLNTTMFQEKQYNLLAYTLYEKSNFFNMSNTNPCLDVRGMWVSLFFDYKSLLQTANYLVFWCASKSLRCEHSHLLELERVCGGMSTIRQTFKTMLNIMGVQGGFGGPYCANRYLRVDPDLEPTSKVFVDFQKAQF